MTDQKKKLKSLAARAISWFGRAGLVTSVAACLLIVQSSRAGASDACIAWADVRNAFLLSANNQASTASGGYGPLPDIFRGPTGTTGPGFLPHVVLFAVSAAESLWQQNNGCTTPPTPYTSPDGGWGLMQITSGRVDNDRYYLFNASHGANILVTKWNNPFGQAATFARVNAQDPNEIEDWLFALWGYNGWGCVLGAADVNSPKAHPPSHYMAWDPSVPRTDYTYEDVVYYYMQHPPGGDGWTAGGFPNDKYYAQLNLGYGPGNDVSAGRGIPSLSSFPASNICPSGQLTTAAVDKGYSWSYVSANYASTEVAGAAYASTLTVQNTGNNVWYNSGAGLVPLGTAALWKDGVQLGGYDHSSPFQYSTWILANRPGTVGDAIVYPVNDGANPTGYLPSQSSFNFNTCPNQAGSQCPYTIDGSGHYAEHYVMVQDGTTWFGDIGVYYDIIVP